MNSPDLTPRAFFDLDRVPWADLFEGAEHAWDVLGERLAGWIREHLRPGNAGQVHPAATLVGDDIEIGAGTIVEPGACIVGPCRIGQGVQVRHAAYLRGPAVIGDGAVVGHATEVKGSIFLPGARAGHFAYVGDSVLGRDVNLGAGTKLANLRLDGGEVVVRQGRRRLAGSGLRKFGAVLGDGVQTGCNSVTNPGTLLPPGCRVLPCVAASGYHPPGTVVGRE